MIGALIGYVASFASGIVATMLVLQVRSFLRERREFAEQDARNEQWDREHGIWMSCVSRSEARP